MSGLRVLLDQITAPVPGGIGRYALELTRALIDTAPPGADVVGFVPSSPEAVYETVTALLPGLTALEKSAFDRRQLAAAWQHGFTRLRGDRFTHAPSLLAPLYRHDRVNHQSDQTVVTIHDAVPWTHPQHLTPRGASWHRAMGRRAERFADAVVVPTHAVADEIASIFDLGDRIRVIGGAVASDLRPPSEEEAAHATRAFDLPSRYVVSVGTLEPRKGLDALIHAMASLDDLDVSLVIVGPKGWGDVDVESVARTAGLEQTRLRVTGFVTDRELAAIVSGAQVFVMASEAEGFGLPLLESMALGTPVVHSDVPALVEVAAGAGVPIPRSGPREARAESIADAIRSILSDDDAARSLRQLGLDRWPSYSWRDSAEKVWQLHADL